MWCLTVPKLTSAEWQHLSLLLSCLSGLGFLHPPYALFVSGEIFVLQWHCSSLLQPMIIPYFLGTLKSLSRFHKAAQTWRQCQGPGKCSEEKEDILGTFYSPLLKRSPYGHQGGTLSKKYSCYPWNWGSVRDLQTYHVSLMYSASLRVEIAEKKDVDSLKYTISRFAIYLCKQP